MAWPGRGYRRQQGEAQLHPSEFGPLVSCEEGPVALALPLRARRRPRPARAGEIDALEWEDVDLEHKMFHVHRATDGRPGGGTRRRRRADTAWRVLISKRPFCRSSRRCTLFPGSGLAGPLCAAPPWRRRGPGQAASVFLRRAGVSRPELFVTHGHAQGNHLLRLRARPGSRGGRPRRQALNIMQHAGHATFNTTHIYIREAENFRADFGAPSSRPSRPLCSGLPRNAGPEGFGFGFRLSAPLAPRNTEKQA